MSEKQGDDELAELARRILAIETSETGDCLESAGPIIAASLLWLATAIAAWVAIEMAARF